MARINREEYQILKSLDNKRKWIADKKPYNIAELIQEYEIENGMRYDFGKIKVVDIDTSKLATKNGYIYVKESEELEVKKNIEWANGEIKKVRDLLNNKRYEEEVDDLTTGVLSGLKKALNILSQLDEREILSQEWVANNSVYASSDGVTEEYVHVDDLQSLLVPKQELPVIPNFVADWMKENHGYNIYGALSAVDKEKHSEVHDWVFLKGCINDFTRAWLDGYTIANEEEEQKYRVENSHGRTILAKMTYSNRENTFEKVEPYNESIVGYKKELTEQEIKDYDERYFAFAVKVEELEE